MIGLSFLITNLFFLMFAQIQSTTDWRGLSPLKSNRMDVERTLGPPDETIENHQITYYYPDVVVRFHFSSNPQCRQKLDYTSWNVTSDTVTGIVVTLKHSPSVEETGIDLTKFKKIKGAHDMINHFYYVNSDDDGFAIEVSNSYVGAYHYAPGSQHKNLRCERSTNR